MNEAINEISKGIGKGISAFLGGSPSQNSIDQPGFEPPNPYGAGFNIGNTTLSVTEVSLIAVGGFVVILGGACCVGYLIYRKCCVKTPQAYTIDEKASLKEEWKDAYDTSVTFSHDQSEQTDKSELDDGNTAGEGRERYDEPKETKNATPLRGMGRGRGTPLGTPTGTPTKNNVRYQT